MPELRSERSGNGVGEVEEGRALQTERMCKAPLLRGNVVTDRSLSCGWSGENKDLTRKRYC